MSTHRASTTNSGGFRAVAKPPVPYQRANTGAPTTVGEQAARQGWTPAHTPPRGQPVVGDGKALRVLRAVTYVLVSLASLLFILLVVYGALSFFELRAAFPRFFGG